MYREKVEPFNKTQGKQVEWLLIRPAGTKRWQLPKGTIDQGEKSGIAAIREVFEETGVKSEIVKKLESVRYFYFQGGERVFKTVIFFVMRSEGEEPTINPKFAHEIGEVVWAETSEALESLTFKGEKRILEKAASLV